MNFHCLRTNAQIATNRLVRIASHDNFQNIEFTRGQSIEKQLNLLAPRDYRVRVVGLLKAFPTAASIVSLVKGYSMKSIAPACIASTTDDSEGIRITA